MDEDEEPLLCSVCFDALGYPYTISITSGGIPFFVSGPVCPHCANGVKRLITPDFGYGMPLYPQGVDKTNG